MRVRTRKRDDYVQQLVVEKADIDDEIFVSAQSGSFYLHRDDVPNLVKALQWGAKKKSKS